jgi:tetratricopeptide (TPR) repeat protein
MTATRSLAMLGCLAALACVSAPPPPIPVATPWDAPGAERIAPTEEERELWKRAEELREEVEKGELLLGDAALDVYLAGVMHALLPRPLPSAAPRPTVHVIRDVDLQGGTSADGTILISVGMLAVLENEAQLAGLLGHELAHFLARHGLIEKRFQAVSVSTVERMALARRHEEQADSIGLRLMSAAGYDPRQMIRMLALLKDDDSRHRTPHPAWESHPYIEARMQLVANQVGTSASGRDGIASYEAAIVDLLAVAAQIEIEAGLHDRARATLARYQRLAPEAGRGFYLKGELERLAQPKGRRSPQVRAAYERAVELAPQDADALRALGLLCRDLGEDARARELLGRYVRVAPQAADRALIERYLENGATGENPSAKPPALR